jgi:hypothetical protein
MAGGRVYPGASLLETDAIQLDWQQSLLLHAFGINQIFPQTLKVNEATLLSRVLVCVM